MASGKEGRGHRSSAGRAWRADSVRLAPRPRPAPRTCRASQRRPPPSPDHPRHDARLSRITARHPAWRREGLADRQNQTAGLTHAWLAGATECLFGAARMSAPTSRSSRQNGGSLVLAVTSDCDAPLPMLERTSDPADYSRIRPPTDCPGEASFWVMSHGVVAAGRLGTRLLALGRRRRSGTRPASRAHRPSRRCRRASTSVASIGVLATGTGNRVWRSRHSRPCLAAYVQSNSGTCTTESHYRAGGHRHGRQG